MDKSPNIMSVLEFVFVGGGPAAGGDSRPPSSLYVRLYRITARLGGTAYDIVIYSLVRVGLGIGKLRDIAH